MQKKIVKANPMGFWHLMLEFEDGTKQMVHRGDLERHDPKPGDIWPPDGQRGGGGSHSTVGACAVPIRARTDTRGGNS